MTAESQRVDPYDAVIADLEAQRDRIDKTIQNLKALRAGGVAPTTGASPGQTDPGQVDNVDAPGAFNGMTIADAAKKLLQNRKRTLTNADIVAALRAAGFPMHSAEPINTVGSVLTRRFNNEGDIVRVSRGTWGLQEWYPGRSFKKSASKEEANGDDSSEPEPPSQPPPAAASASKPLPVKPRPSRRQADPD